jgi:hypothetical protein
LALHNIKKLVVFVVLMPVILSLDDPEADHRVIYLAESLVVPREFARVRKSLFIDYLQGFVQKVEACLVRVGGSCCHGDPFLLLLRITVGLVPSNTAV